MSGRDFLYHYLKQKNKRQKGQKEKKLGKNDVNFLIEIVLLCEISGQPVRYKGWIKDYRLKDDTLEYLQLTNVHRTLLTSEKYNENEKLKITSLAGMLDKFKSFLGMPTSIDKQRSVREFENPTDINFFRITGELMIFKGSEIKNYNVSYKEFQI